MGDLHVQESTEKFGYLDNCFIIIKLLLGNINQQLFTLQVKHKAFFFSISFPSVLTFS